MKHPSCRGLHAYWTERGGERPVPERGDIEPAAIRHLLGDSFVLSGWPDGCRFRVAGTRICALLGRELRGEPFTSIWHADAAMLTGQALAAVSEEGIGFVAGVEASSRGDAATYELLVLPLSHRGVLGARLIGVLAAFERPAWLGTWPAEPLHLGALRYLSGAAPLHSGDIATPDPLLLRRNFTIINGGLVS